MAKIFALLGVLLIITGVVLLAAPKSEPPMPAPSAGTTRSVGVGPREVTGLVSQVREIAEQVNAPLSILFGLMSLFYTRRTYLAQRGGPPPGGTST